MSNPAVEWAEKMASVLGEKAQRAKEAVLGPGETVAKVPKDGGTAGGNGAPSGNGAPTGAAAPAAGSAAPATGGGAPAPGGAPAGGAAPAPDKAPATGGDAPAAGGAPASGGGTPAPGGGGAPAGGGTPPTAPQAAPAKAAAGNDAKAFAEMAKKSLAEANAILEAAKADEAESKKILGDAQAGKKQADTAKQQAEAAEKSIPPAPKVPVPQGKDPKTQYEAAIKITGDMQKISNDAEAKIAAIDEQGGVAEVGKASVEAAAAAAKKSAQKLQQAVEKATFAAEGAIGAANSAVSKAAESKQKADEAAKQASAKPKDGDKDKPADKAPATDVAALKKQAEEDAKYAAEAKDAGAKAQAAAKQVETAAKCAETQSQNIEKLSGEAKTVADAVKEKTKGQFEKVQPHFTAVGDAGRQEADYKSKLSTEDAESVLEKRYIELGGDPELTKLFADEDKEFEALTEKYRAELKRWQDQKIRELDEHKRNLESVLKGGEAVIPPAKKWLQIEDSPATEKIKADAQSLGPEKLGTEPGKQLMLLVDERTVQIARIKQKTEYNEKLIEATKAEMETLKERYKDVDKQYETGETFLKERRTELDNLLEIERLDLEMKVYYLQSQPKPVRDSIKKQTDNELARVTQLAILEAKAEVIEFEAAPDPAAATPIDWKPVQQSIEKLKAATVEDLKKNDPKLDDIRAEYDKAGGDAALLDKRVANWQKEVEGLKKLEQERSQSFEARSEKMRGQMVDTDAKLREIEQDRDGMKGVIAYQKRQLEDFAKQEKDLNGEPLPTQDKAQKTLMERELKRYETQLKNLEAQYEAAKGAKANSEKLVEQERQRHEQVMDDDRSPLPKPTSDDITKLPLTAKYTELTGKSAPA